MTNAKLTFILAIVAAVLALAAALIEYVRQGEVNLALIGAGLFLPAWRSSAEPLRLRQLATRHPAVALAPRARRQ